MDSRIYQEVQCALFACWREVDINSGIHTHEFYETDGELWLGTRGFRGREEIRRFYAWRRSGLSRTTRHLVINPIADFASNVVTVNYTLVVFAGTGDVPTITAPPNTISDATAQLARHGDGWMFRHHQLVSVMVGGQNGLQIPDELPV